MDKTIIKVLEKIEDKGYKAYVVGGYVRDYILGIKSTDIDIATNALPKDLALIFDNYDINSSQYGAFKLITDKYNFDITTFRIEYEYIGRRPNKIEYVNDLKDDLKRRDFTVNTLAMNKEQKVIDLLNAQEDLNNKLIRCVGNPKIKLMEDPLRILRALRFAIILDFAIEESLLETIINYKDLIKSLSWERKKYELDCILTSKNAIQGLELLKSLGILDILGISYENIVYVVDKCGIYAQLAMPEDYPFTNREKNNIKNIKEIIKYGKIDNHVLFKYGLYYSTVAGAILGILPKRINEINNNLPIKNLKDIKLNSDDICELLQIKPCKVLKDVEEEIKYLILNEELENNEEKIKKYIIINMKKWI